MKNKFLKLAVISFVGIALLNSCKKEGCTDSDSKNYDSEAKKDDGTCTYEGNVVIWYGLNTSDSLYYDGSDALTFYVNGKVVGSTNVNVYWTSAPNCGDNGSISVTMNLGNVKTQSYSYKVYDDLDDLIWSGNVNFNANTCTALELTY